ncbi:MAG: hypothetical protein JNL05_14805 [Flavobacteriales bacterium]|nr:hypothetical protein [Flavobacteriales bacterium]
MRTWSVIALLIGALQSSAQDTVLVRYRPGFDLHEGIYLGFEDLRDDRPSLPLARLKDAKGAPLPDLAGGRQVFVSDSTGALVQVDLDRIWGLCSNNTVYIHAGDGLFRIGMMGSLCHVLYERSYRDWSNVGYYGPMSPMGGPVTRTVQEQRVLDMATGELRPLTSEGLDPLIRRDEVLYEEWNAVPPKKRKEELLFQFIRRYNDRNALYFPVAQ